MQDPRAHSSQTTQRAHGQNALLFSGSSSSSLSSSLRLTAKEATSRDSISIVKTRGSTRLHHAQRAAPDASRFVGMSRKPARRIEHRRDPRSAGGPAPALWPSFGTLAAARRARPHSASLQILGHCRAGPSEKFRLETPPRTAETLRSNPRKFGGVKIESL